MSNPSDDLNQTGEPQPVEGGSINEANVQHAAQLNQPEAVAEPVIEGGHVAMQEGSEVAGVVDAMQSQVASVADPMQDQVAPVMNATQDLGQVAPVVDPMQGQVDQGFVNQGGFANAEQMQTNFPASDESNQFHYSANQLPQHVVAPLRNGFGHDIQIPDFSDVTPRKSSKARINPSIAIAIISIGLAAILIGIFITTQFWLKQDEVLPTAAPLPKQTTMPAKPPVHKPAIMEEEEPKDTALSQGEYQPEVIGSINPEATTPEGAPAPSGQQPATEEPEIMSELSPPKDEGGYTILAGYNEIKVEAKKTQVVALKNAKDVKAEYNGAFSRSTAEGFLYLPAGVPLSFVRLTDLSGNPLNYNDYEAFLSDVVFVKFSGGLDSYVAKNDTCVWTDSSTLRDGKLRYFVIGPKSQKGNSVMARSVEVPLDFQ